MLVSQIRDYIKTNYCKPTVHIGVIGEYASGKTVFCKEILASSENEDHKNHLIESDMYFLLSKPQRQALFSKLKKSGQYNERIHEGYALDEMLINDHMKKIHNRQDIGATGLYQRDTGEKDRKFELQFGDGSNWIFFDGVWVVNPIFAEYMDFMIDFTADIDVRRSRAHKRSQVSGNSYTQSPERFAKIDGFTKQYLALHKHDIQVSIDNTDYSNPVMRCD